MANSDEFTCTICWEIAEEAVESSCCHHIFCHNCVTRLNNNNCALCRQMATYAPSFIIRRVISNMSCKCIHCQNSFTRGTIKDHELICGPTECQVPQCGFKTNKENYLNHLTTNHKEFMLKNINNLFLNREDMPNTDPIATKTNEAGFTARLGSSGKYYCGKNLDPFCYCCDGFCGPTNGCNCNHCMKLDIEARRLPKGYLVNSEGATCRKGETGIYYCGRKVMDGHPTCDGYCGPTNGPNCSSCERLDTSGRYDNLK